jgi:hypothetical protein
MGRGRRRYLAGRGGVLMSIQQWGLGLGQPVCFRTCDALTRHSFMPDGDWFNPVHLEWRRRGGKDHWISGVVVGVRTLADGKIIVTDGREFHPTHTFRAVMVATDIRRKPVLVKIEDIHQEES